MHDHILAILGLVEHNAHVVDIHAARLGPEGQVARLGLVPTQGGGAGPLVGAAVADGCNAPSVAADATAAIALFKALRLLMFLLSSVCAVLQSPR